MTPSLHNPIAELPEASLTRYALPDISDSWSFLLVQLSLTALSLVFLTTLVLTIFDISLLGWHINISSENPLGIHLVVLSGIATGVVLTFLFISFLQSRSAGSPLSEALTRAHVTRHMAIGSVGAQILLNYALKNPGAGRKFVRRMETLAVTHADTIRIRGKIDHRGVSNTFDLSGYCPNIRTSAENGDYPFITVTALQHYFIVRYGDRDLSGSATDKPANHVIYDGPTRWINIHHKTPESVRHALEQKSAAGIYPLREIMELDGIPEGIMVTGMQPSHAAIKEHLHLNLKPRLVAWQDVRMLLDPDYRDLGREPAYHRLWAILRALGRSSS